jgi:hypothetical protein
MIKTDALQPFYRDGSSKAERLPIVAMHYSLLSIAPKDFFQVDRNG